MELEGVHRTLTPRSTAVIYIRRCANALLNVCEMLEPGSGSGIGNGNKAIIISAKRQSHTEAAEEHERMRRIARGANNK